MNLRLTLPAVSLFVAALLSPVSVAHAQDKQAGTFDLVLSDQKIGKSVFKIEKTKNGYKLTSRATYRINGNDGDQSDEFKFNDNLGYIDGTTVDHDSQMQTSYVPNKTRDQVTVTRFQQSGHDTDVVSAKPDLIVLPAFDAGAAQVALLLATMHPTAENKYSLLIPGSHGGGGGGRGGGGAAAATPNGTAPDTLPPGNNALDVTFVKGKETSGILDGKPVLLTAYLFGIGGFRLILYADHDNNLMQLNAAAFHASYIRQNFKLNMGAQAPPPTQPAAKP